MVLLEESNSAGLPQWHLCAHLVDVSYVSDPKGNGVNIKTVVTEGKLFSVPNHPGHSFERTEKTFLSGTASRRKAMPRWHQ